jgi:hypothetical protein
MPSPAYSSLLNLVSTYVEPQKATEVIARQLVACKLTPDTVSPADVKASATRFATACGLYIPDASKRDELKNKIAAFG